MRKHVPVLLAKLRERFPGLKVTLQEIDQRGAEQPIAQGEADLAIMVLESKLPPSSCSVTLARLPLCLLVPADQTYRRAADLLKEGAAGNVPLISLPPHEVLPRLFPKGNGPAEHRWRTTTETSSQDSVSIYVRNGLGAWLAVQTPELQRDSGLHVLPLSGFPACQSESSRAGASARSRRCSSTNWRAERSAFLENPKSFGRNILGTGLNDAPYIVREDELEPFRASAFDLERT
jgi:DNA-binding transcriptional LysR family regulator